MKIDKNTNELACCCYYWGSSKLYASVYVQFYILSPTTYKASYLETDGVQRTMFRMGHILARDDLRGILY